MRADALFVAVYAAGLLTLSAGLHRIGRVRTDPWASRVLAGNRPGTDDAPAPGTVVGWPHSEVPRLYTGMALVAAIAATLLAAVELTRRHHVAEVVVLGLVAFAGLGALAPLTAQLRRRR